MGQCKKIQIYSLQIVQNEVIEWLFESSYRKYNAVVYMSKRQDVYVMIILNYKHT